MAKHNTFYVKQPSEGKLVDKLVKVVSEVSPHVISPLISSYLGLTNRPACHDLATLGSLIRTPVLPLNWDASLWMRKQSLGDSIFEMEFAAMC